MAFQRQAVDLARMGLELDRLTASLHLCEASVQEARKGNVAATPLFVKAVPKLHIRQHVATKHFVSRSPASLKHGAEADFSDNQSVDRSNGSTAVSHVDGSWTYINSQRTDQSSFVWVHSQASSVADTRVTANTEFSSPPTSPSAEESLSSDVQEIGSWLTNICAIDARTLLSPQESSGRQSSPGHYVELESEVDRLMNIVMMQPGRSVDDHCSLTWGWKTYPRRDDERPTTEPNDVKLAGCCCLLPYHDEAPWTHLSTVGA